MRLKVNASKSGVGRPRERKFLGFTINPEGKIEVVLQSGARSEQNVRERWRGGQRLSRSEPQDNGCAYGRGGWACFGLAEHRRNVFGLEGWMRRPIRKYFWERWHDGRGRLRKRRHLGLGGRLLKGVHRSRGAWRLADWQAKVAQIEQAMANLPG